jgi:hypothetical protein
LVLLVEALLQYQERLITFKNSSTLADFYNNMRNPNTIEEEDQTTLVDEVSPDLPYAKTYLQSLQPPLL